MKKLAILLFLTTVVYADNTEAFNNAYQLGKQNQFNLNLNRNSTFDSFGQANKLESNIINNANAGNATAQPMYNGATNDPNYLFNQGKADIASCQSKNDPRCTSLNKYGDKDTQTQFQAYNQGLSSKYSIVTRPDPSDSSCTQVIRKVPIGESTKTCIASAHQQPQCNANINISVNTYQCDHTHGGCRRYQNPDCSLIAPYVAPIDYFDYQFIGPWRGRADNTLYCSGRLNATQRRQTVQCAVTCPSKAQASIYHAIAGNGNQSVNNSSGSWLGNSCGEAEKSGWSVHYSEKRTTVPGQDAVYRCKSYNYSDGCASFK